MGGWGGGGGSNLRSYPPLKGLGKNQAGKKPASNRLLHVLSPFPFLRGPFNAHPPPSPQAIDIQGPVPSNQAECQSCGALTASDLIGQRLRCQQPIAGQICPHHGGICTYECMDITSQIGWQICLYLNICGQKISTSLGYNREMVYYVRNNQ